MILPVHIYGRAAPMEEILRLAKRLDAPIVEDAAQSIGAFAEVGGASVMTGAIGELGALSFFPSKNLGGAGDGGMVLARTQELGDAVAMLRVHGSRIRYQHERVGINSRLDALQAAVLSVSSATSTAGTRRVANAPPLIATRFDAAGLAPGPIVLPDDAGKSHVWHQFVVRAARRDELRAALLEAGRRDAGLLPDSPARSGLFRGSGLPGRRASRMRARRARGARVADLSRARR